MNKELYTDANPEFMKQKKLFRIIFLFLCFACIFLFSILSHYLKDIVINNFLLHYKWTETIGLYNGEYTSKTETYKGNSHEYYHLKISGECSGKHFSEHIETKELPEYPKNYDITCYNFSDKTIILPTDEINIAQAYFISFAWLLFIFYMIFSFKIFINPTNFLKNRKIMEKMEANK